MNVHESHSPLPTILEESLAMMERSMKDICEGRTKPDEQALREIAQRLGLSLQH